MEPNSNPDKDRIINRVRKMLNLANDAGATEGERDNAMRMAHATIAKYNLDLAACEASGQSKVDDEPRECYIAVFYGRPWARVVAQASAKLFFCYYLYRSATKGKDTKHEFVGRHSNAVTAAEMAEYLVRSIQREAARAARYAGEGNTFLRSFALGAAHKIRQRVDEIIRKSENQHSEGPGTAIVLASLYASEHSANQLVVHKLYPVLRAGRTGKGVGAFDGYSAGVAYGSTVSLNRQIR